MEDAEINRLLSIGKHISNPRARRIEKRGSIQVNYEAVASSGEQFRVYVRQNMRIPDGFSCGLLYVPVSGETVTLARYNGSDHEHTNPLESGSAIRFKCHIHRATARYIEAGRKAEHFAETTERYRELEGALQALLHDCNITGLEDPTMEPDPQMALL